MTDQEIAQALESMIKDDANRSPEEQIRDLIEAGVIDEQGRVLLGNKDSKTVPQNGPRDASSPRKVAGT